MQGILARLAGCRVCRTCSVPYFNFRP
jgi:hypothetical protein